MVSSDRCEQCSFSPTTLGDYCAKHRPKMEKTRDLGRCCGLNRDGRRCHRKATHICRYHGDHELYGRFDKRPTWVRVQLCDRCDPPEKGDKK